MQHINPLTNRNISMTKILSISRKKTAQDVSKDEVKKDFVEKKLASGVTVKIKVNDKTKSLLADKKFNGKKAFDKNKRKKFIKKKDDRLLILDERVTFEKFINRECVQEALKLLRLFGDRFDFYNPKPMAKDMFKVARERLKGMQLPISNLMLRRAFKFYAESPRYAEKYVVGAMRYDLDGKPTTAITQEELSAANKICRQTRKNVQFKARKVQQSTQQGK